MRLNGCMQAESLTGCYAGAALRSATCPICGRRWPKYSLQRTRAFKTCKPTPCPLSTGSIKAGKADGGASTDAGTQAETDYRTLTAKYLRRTDLGIWETDSRLPKMYRALKRLNASELTIFLLVLELGTVAAAARRLKVHRSTVHRLYHKIEKKIRNELK